MGDEHVIEDDDTHRLAIFGGELGGSFPRTARRTGNDGHAGRVARHRAADCKILILGCVSAARHYQELVHIGSARYDSLGPPDDNTVLPPILDVDIGIRVCLHYGPLRAVTLATGTPQADAQDKTL